MKAEKLTYMANQIATFFESRPEAEGIQGVADHISDFWEPRMREQLFDILADDTNTLKPLVKAAADKIRKPITID